MVFSIKLSCPLPHLFMCMCKKSKSKRYAINLARELFARTNLVNNEAFKKAISFPIIKLVKKRERESDGGRERSLAFYHRQNNLRCERVRERKKENPI
jgi:hypothetical protein